MIAQGQKVNHWLKEGQERFDKELTHLQSDDNRVINRLKNGQADIQATLDSQNEWMTTMEHKIAAESEERIKSLNNQLNPLKADLTMLNLEILWLGG